MALSPATVYKAAEEGPRFSCPNAGALRLRQGIIPDLMINTRPMGPSENLARALGDRTLVDMKAQAPGTSYSASTSTAVSNSVEKRQKQVSPAYQAAARSLVPRRGT